MIRESLRRIIALIKKEFITIWKDPKSRGIIIALPLMQLFVFANAITMEVKNIDVALIDSANTVKSRELLSRFEPSPRFRKFYYAENEADLKEKIESCLTLSALEDLYRPYKPKRETRGSKAIKKGLKPLAEFIQDGKNPNLDEEAKKYISEEKDVKSAQEAIAGALDIIAEEISDNPNYRTFIKKLAYKNGKVVAKKIEGCEIMILMQIIVKKYQLLNLTEF